MQKFSPISSFAIIGKIFIMYTVLPEFHVICNAIIGDLYIQIVLHKYIK